MTVQAPQVRPAKAFLLTGAGFSRPFGGYLASEMWALIFRQPEVRASDRLRRKMLGEMNFERVYEDVMTSAYSEDEKHGLTEAIGRAYRQMHDEMCNENQTAAAHEVVRAFISRFDVQDQAERGFVFTLNQDLLIEKFRTADLPILLPGVHEPDGQNVTLPDAATLEKAAQEFSGRDSGRGLAYLKLHGSFNWRRHDGSPALVIGANKGRALSTEPILKWYQEIFRNVLHEPGRSLLVIGYGFRDTHINETILSAVKSAGLRLFVMSPRTPEDFKDSICGARRNQMRLPGQGDEIWESLYGYYCGSVESFYTSHHVQLPPQGRALFRDLGL